MRFYHIFLIVIFTFAIAFSIGYVSAEKCHFEYGECTNPYCKNYPQTLKQNK
jgi:hypothetical protein